MVDNKGQVEEDIENDRAADIEVEPDAQVEGSITQFNPDHIITIRAFIYQLIKFLSTLDPKLLEGLS
jgi:hypothetical protein